MIYKIFLLLCVVFFIIACGNNKSGNKVTPFLSNTDTLFIKSDSMIYELPPKATNMLLKMISDKKVSFCRLSADALEDSYSFGFPYDDKTLYSFQDTILLSKTNTYLKLDTFYFPLLRETDYIFIKKSKELPSIINDFNSCFITVDVKGNIKDGYAF